MPSTYTTRLRLEKQADGENDTSWGSRTNTVFDLIDDAISGMTTVATTGGTTTLTTNNSAADEARRAILKVTGALVSNATIVIPAQTKTYLVWNATSGAYTLTIKTSGGVGVVVTQGYKAIIFCDGTDCYTAHNDTSLASAFPSGTRLLFQQTTAPTGWTKEAGAAYNNVALRVVTGAVGTGGAVDFTTAFAAGLSSNSYTLQTADIPAHAHSGTTDSGGGSHSHTGTTDNANATHSHGAATAAGGVDHTHSYSGTTDSGGSHDHSFAVSAGPGGDNVIFIGSSLTSGTSYTDAGGAHTHTYSGTTNGASAYSHAHTINADNATHSHGFTTGSTSIAHTHTFSTGNTGGGGGHAHALPSFAVKYADCVIAVKD